MAELEEIGARFRAHLDRVRSLVGLYEETTTSDRGRKPVPVADLLRAAVVLLHASLEDLLRSLAAWKLPSAPTTSLEKILIVVSEDKIKEKITLDELAAHRGQTVAAVVDRSIAKHLENSTYNNVKDVVGLLGRIEVDCKMDDGLKSKLAAMMNRRHWIAHRVDRNPRSGAGHQAARAISRSIVVTWIGSVEVLGTAILDEIQSTRPTTPEDDS